MVQSQCVIQDEGKDYLVTITLLNKKIANILIPKDIDEEVTGLNLVTYGHYL